MSYPLFFLLSLAAVAVLAAVIPGPQSWIIFVGFWSTHYFFLKWLHFYAPVESMSDYTLSDVLNWWTGYGPFGRSQPELTRARWKNADALEFGLKRVVNIYNERIKRLSDSGIGTSEYEIKRSHLLEELSEIKMKQQK